MKNRYQIAKDYKAANGRQSWGVYDTVTKKIIEGGFFSKDAACGSAVDWNIIEAKETLFKRQLQTGKE